MDMSKLDEIKEKLEGFISELKSKLPGGSKDEDDDFDDEFDEDTGEFDVDTDDSTDVDVGGDDDDEEAEASEQDDSDEDEDDEDEDDEDDEDPEGSEKAEKKKKLIRVGLIAVVALLAVDFLIPKDDSEQTDEAALIAQQQAARAKRNKNKKKKRKKKAAENKAAQQKNDTKKDTAQPKEAAKTETPKAADPAPKVAEPVQTPDAPKVVEPVKTPEAPKVVEPVPTAKPVEKAVEQKVAETKTEAPIVDVPPDTNAVPLGMEKRMGESEQPLKLKDDEKSKSLEDQMKKIAKQTDDQKKVEEEKQKMEDSLKYTEPPNYTRPGRGLVYNCVEKHWACVDKFAYFQCRENYRWSKSNNKSTECVIKNVYISEQDCSKVQAYYVNTNEPTDFCEQAGESAEDKSLEDGATELIIQ